MVIGNFLKRLCTYLSYFSGYFYRPIYFETKQKSKYKVDFKFIFILIEKNYFGNVLNIFGENLVTNQIFIPHVTCYISQLI